MKGSRRLYYWLILGVLSAVFVFLICLYWDFVLDDAYIAYRYSRNWVDTGDLLWNLSQDPVEGFTSFLWVLVNAAGILMGSDPVVTSKAVSGLAGLIVIFLLGRAGSKNELGLFTIFVGGVALSPPFAFLTSQGMETTFTALLILCGAILSCRVIEKQNIGSIIIFYLIAFLSMLSRPDAGVFYLGLIGGIVGVISCGKGFSYIRRIIYIGLIFVLVGLSYMIWRYKYFGFCFPNPFYIKVSKGMISESGAKYVAGFIIQILLPYLVAVVILLRDFSKRKSVLTLVPSILGVTLFVAYLFSVTPIQGFFWRYAFPVFPVIMFAFLRYFNGISVLSTKNNGSRVVSVFLVGLFVIWNLQHLPSTLSVMKTKSQYDRVVVGKALSTFHGKMLTSEAGALPYFSGWEAVDVVGLTSEEIVHNGFSYDLLERLDPDIIMLLDYPLRLYKKEEYKIIDRYMTNNQFMAVAAIQKTSGRYHYYFVNNNSRIYKDLVRCLRNVSGVEYGNLKKLLGGYTMVSISSEDI